MPRSASKRTYNQKRRNQLHMALHTFNLPISGATIDTDGILCHTTGVRNTSMRSSCYRRHQCLVSPIHRLRHPENHLLYNNKIYIFRIKVSKTYLI